MTTDELPPENTTWETGHAYQPQVPLGNVARWLVRNVVVTGLSKDRLDPKDLIRTLEQDHPKDEMGHWGGHTRAEVFARARELMPGFPRTTYPGTGSEEERRKGLLVGVRLLNPLSKKSRPSALTLEAPTRTIRSEKAGSEKKKLDKAPRSQIIPEQTPEPAASQTARTCKICSADISQRRPNARKCWNCRYSRLPLTELRRTSACERKCLDCEADISLTVHNTLRCKECAPEHRIKQGREYRSRPEIQQRDKKHRAKPENRASRNKYQKEYYEEHKKSTARKVKADTQKLNTQVDEKIQIPTVGRSSTPTLKEPALTG